MLSQNNDYCDQDKVEKIFKELQEQIISYIPEDQGKLVECEQMGYIAKP